MDKVYESDFLKLPESEQNKLKKMLKDVEMPTLESIKEHVKAWFDGEIKPPILSSYETFGSY